MAAEARRGGGRGIPLNLETAVHDDGSSDIGRVRRRETCRRGWSPSLRRARARQTGRRLSHHLHRQPRRLLEAHPGPDERCHGPGATRRLRSAAPPRSLPISHTPTRNSSQRSLVKLRHNHTHHAPLPQPNHRHPSQGVSPARPSHERGSKSPTLHAALHRRTSWWNSNQRG